MVIALTVAVFAGACDLRTKAADGDVLFGETCARCHGHDGRGDPTAKAQLGVPDMTAAAWQAAHSDDDIRLTVRQGSKSKKMPPFGELYSARQLDAIVAHVRRLAAAR